MAQALLDNYPAPAQQAGEEALIIKRKGITCGTIFAKGPDSWIAKVLQEVEKSGGASEIKWAGFSVIVGKDKKTGLPYAALRRSDRQMPQSLVFVFDKELHLAGVSDGMPAGRLSYDDTERGRVSELYAYFRPFFGPKTQWALGLSDDEISRGRAALEENERRYARFVRENKGDLGTLPKFDGKVKAQDERVLQGEGVVLGAESNRSSLYTTGAGNCILIAAVLRDKFTCEAKRVALGHFDFMSERKDYDEFFSKIKQGGPGELEVRILSGSGFKTLDAFDAASNAGTVVFMNADMDGERIDSAMIKKDGTVYWSSDIIASKKAIERDRERFGRFLKGEHEMIIRVAE